MAPLRNRPRHHKRHLQSPARARRTLSPNLAPAPVGLGRTLITLAHTNYASGLASCRPGGPGQRPARADVAPPCHWRALPARSRARRPAGAACRLAGHQRRNKRIPRHAYQVPAGHHDGAVSSLPMSNWLVRRAGSGPLDDGLLARASLGPRCGASPPGAGRQASCSLLPALIMRHQVRPSAPALLQAPVWPLANVRPANILNFRLENRKPGRPAYIRLASCLAARWPDPPANRFASVCITSGRGAHATMAQYLRRPSWLNNGAAERRGHFEPTCRPDAGEPHGAAARCRSWRAGPPPEARGRDPRNEWPQIIRRSFAGHPWPRPPAPGPNSEPGPALGHSMQLTASSYFAPISS